MEGPHLHKNERDEESTSSETNTINHIKGKRLEWFKSGINDEANEAIVDWFKKTKEKYPDIRDYLLVHALIGSTSGPGVTKFDLPGEDSVQLFVKSLSEKLAGGQ